MNRPPDAVHFIDEVAPSFRASLKCGTHGLNEKPPTVT